MVRTQRVAGGGDGDALAKWRGRGELADEPAVGLRIVEQDRVAVVAAGARAAKALPQRADVGGAVERCPGLVENLNAGVDDLIIVVRTDIAVGIRRDRPPLVVHTVEIRRRAGDPAQVAEEVLDH